jgi:hypothetical protein
LEGNTMTPTIPNTLTHVATMGMLPLSTAASVLPTTSLQPHQQPVQPTFPLPLALQQALHQARFLQHLQTQQILQAAAGMQQMMMVYAWGGSQPRSITGLEPRPWATLSVPQTSIGDAVVGQHLGQFPMQVVRATGILTTSGITQATPTTGSAPPTQLAWAPATKRAKHDNDS